MKKALALAMVLAAGLTTTAFADDVINVDYYCSVGAYANVLQEDIAAWNEGAGKEAGVFINFMDDISEYSNHMDAFLQAGTYYDIFDCGINPAWVSAGYIQDLSTIENDEMKELIAGYEKYLHNGTNWQQGILVGMPLEVLPVKLAVNKDLFEASGLEYPTTLDELVADAIQITEDNDGEKFGYGWSTWSACFRRLAMKATQNSTGTAWWNPEAEAYDFTPFKPIVEAMKTMYEAGAVLGADDLDIDQIRAQFAAGNVAMFPAPAYDVSVYTNQFPAECNWEIIDMPLYTADTEKANGVFLERIGCSISAQAWEEADDAKKDAIVKAFCFLNSDELNGDIYANGGMIPYKTELIESTELKIDIPQWAQMSNLEGYQAQTLYPDTLIPLEGDNYGTVFAEIMHGDAEWDDVIDDLNERYNAAYQSLKEDGQVDLSVYQAQ